jgi:hypothetical protein
VAELPVAAGLAPGSLTRSGDINKNLAIRAELAPHAYVHDLQMGQSKFNRSYTTT